MEKEFYIGQIFNEPYPPEVAVWCNNNNAFIEEIENRVYEIKTIPEPAIEDKEKKVRFIRNEYLEETDKFVSIPDFPIDSETKELYIKYRQYLRDYTKLEDWYKQNPKTFEEWSE